MDMIYPYVKSTQLFVCPSASSQTVPSYGYNYYLHTADSWANVYGSLASVEEPSMTALSMEINSVYALYTMSCLEGGKWLIDKSSSHHKEVVPHMDGSNFLFFDGHVKWLSANSGIPQSGVCSGHSSTSVFWNPQGTVTY